MLSRSAKVRTRLHRPSSLFAHLANVVSRPDAGRRSPLAPVRQQDLHVLLCHPCTVFREPFQPAQSRVADASSSVSSTLAPPTSASRLHSPTRPRLPRFPFHSPRSQCQSHLRSNRDRTSSASSATRSASCRFRPTSTMARRLSGASDAPHIGSGERSEGREELARPAGA